MNEAVIWHDLECGRYEQDLPLWLELAAEHAAAPGSAVLDVGAGTGRVALALSQAGHRVVALDNDAELLEELARRAGELPVETACADARDFTLGDRGFPLIVVPMQTLQLLGGAAGRERFMRCARRHLSDGGVLAAAIAISDDFEEFEWRDGDRFPLPDIIERDGNVYCSQPTAVRRERDVFILQRRREVIDAAGGRRTTHDRIGLDVLSADDVAEAGQRAGLKPLDVRLIAPTSEHIGSEVVVLGV